MARFVAAQIPGCERGWQNFSAIGFEEEGRIVAGIVYHNWSPESGVIELTAASLHRRWLTRERLALVFGYPFSFCRMAVARIDQGNTRARRIWRSLGAKEHVIPGLRSPTSAEVVYTLDRADWQAGKFGGAHGQA